MKEKYFQDLYEQIDVPHEDVQQSIRTGLQKAGIKEKKKTHSFRNASVVAIIVISAITTLSFSFPSFAANLPFVGSIYELFKNNSQESVFERYGDHSTLIGQTKESNGITITLIDAVYDGEDITVAYLIDSTKDLGKRPVLGGDFAVEGLNEKYKNLYSSDYIVEKINAHQYAVVSIYQFMDGPKPSELRVNWEGVSITDLYNVNNTTTGNWSFEFSLSELDQESKLFANKNVNTEEEGIKISAVKMTETPISTTYYLSEKIDIRTISMEEEEWRGVQVDYIVADNLGNEYETILHREGVHSTDFDESGRSKTRITTTVIHKEATSIIITPIINIYRMANSDGWLELVKQPYTIKPIEVPLSN